VSFLGRLQEAVQQMRLFEDSDTVDAPTMRRICQELGEPCRFSNDDDEHAEYVVLDGEVYTLPFDPWYDDPKSVSDFVNEASEEDARQFGIVSPSLTEEFWAPGGEPPPLYHATEARNVESILKRGLGARCDTRGISNRCIGAAVFTSTDQDELEDGMYGDAIFRIDTAAMQRDGYMPGLALEPDVEEAEWREALAHRLGADDFSWDVEHGMSANTIAVYGHIPPKYLTWLEDPGSLAHKLGADEEREGNPVARKPRKKASGAVEGPPRKVGCYAGPRLENPTSIKRVKVGCYAGPSGHHPDPRLPNPAASPSCPPRGPIFERDATLEEVVRSYSVAHEGGYHGKAPEAAKLEIVRAKGRHWVLTTVPLRLLDYLRGDDVGTERLLRAADYASRTPRKIPPGIAYYNARSQKKRTLQAFVADGNHRAFAAELAGRPSAKMWMPKGDFEALQLQATGFA